MSPILSLVIGEWTWTYRSEIEKFQQEFVYVSNINDWSETNAKLVV
jgi:hypothetical protein